MGQQQFYSPVKDSVDAIHQDTIAIHEDTQAIKNTDMASLNTKVDGNHTIIMDGRFENGQRFNSLDSAVGSLNWWSKYRYGNNRNYAVQAYQIINITGEGILTGLVQDGSTNGIACSLEIDGSGLGLELVYAPPHTSGNSLIIPFKTSLRITTAYTIPTAFVVQYVLK